MENEFQPDANKKAQEIIFSRKVKKTSQPPLNFNNNSVKQVQFQKHQGIYLDGNLDFPEHLQNMFNFKNYFFPPTVIEWNKLDPNIKNSESLALFKKLISAFIRPFANSTFQCDDPKGSRLNYEATARIKLPSIS